MGCLWQRDAAVAGNKQDAHQFEKRDVPLLCIQIGPTQFDRPLSRTSVGLKRPRDAAYSCPLVRRIFPTLSLNCSRRSSRTSVRIERADPLNHHCCSKTIKLGIYHSDCPHCLTAALVKLDNVEIFNVELRPSLIYFTGNVKGKLSSRP